MDYDFVDAIESIAASFKSIARSLEKIANPPVTHTIPEEEPRVSRPKDAGPVKCDWIQTDPKTGKRLICECGNCCK